jgi:plastocyanin
MSMRNAFALLFLLLGPAAADAATHNVSVISFRFDPPVLEIRPGDTVVWRNTGGSHNVNADNGSFGNLVSASSWTYEHTFDSAGDFRYYCEPHGGPNGIGMAGVVRVVGSTTPPFAISYGTGGTWYNPATSGQGFFVEVIPPLNTMVVAWFTWTGTAGQHDWITAIGPYTGDTATLDLQHSSGGRFNDPAAVTTTSIGSATARFTSCEEGTITFQRSDTGQSGTIPIRRLTVTPAACTNSGTGR